MFDSNQFFGVSAAGGFYPTSIDQSLRFEDGDSANLSQTFSAGDDEKIFTFSVWVKRGNLGAGSDTIFGVGANSTNDGQFYFNSSNQLGFFGRASSSTKANLVTTQVFRDTSSWYHLVVAVDTTESTAADRVKLYVNGEQVTAFDSSTYPSLNDTMTFNGSSVHYLGKPRGDVNPDYDGYLAEVHFTDGTAYTADAFGELKSGIWVPKSPSVTYGTNGFKLTFEDSAAIGDDTSGNGNDWTVNNLVASDVVPDSPTNNFCTMNPLNGSRTLSQGNLRTVATSATYRYSTFAIPSSGKWYWEMLHESDYRSSRFGFANAEALGTGSGDFSGIESSSSGNDYRFDDQTFTDITDFMTSGGTGVIAFAVDMDAGEFDVYLDGVLKTSGTFTSTSDKFVYERSGSTYTIVHFYNFGQDSTFAGNKTAGGNSDDNGIGDFAYAPPSGYLALCTANLPDPVIDPAQDATPEDHFNVVLWTGTGSSQAITGVGFQPDWVWTKDRENSRNHALFDSVRGVTNRLSSDTANAEGIVSGVDSFDSDGVTLGGANQTNGNNIDYVGWFWKAGGTGVSNTVGTIESTVSANTDAGFSIVGYEGNATNGSTVGHGLSSAPELVIIKNRTDSSTNWFVMGYPTNPLFPADGSGLRLNNINAMVDSTSDEIELGSSVMTIVDGGNPINGNGDDYIMYCFHSVDGFSKVGSYTGNSSTDGAFIYTGFRPAFILQKRTDATANWRMWDNRREGYNVDNDELKPNTADAEGTQDRLDFLSNGFKWRDSNVVVNGSSGTYIYLAFAEQPFKYSNAR